MGRRTEAGEPAGASARGVALLMVLVAVALLSLATLLPLRQEQQAAWRERERELLFIGDQYRRAIASYAAATPGGVPQGPKALADLLEDKRYPSPRRHLRRLYADPMTGRADWMLLMEQGAIAGVASRSPRVPLKHSGFAEADRDFADASSYAEWKFVAKVAAAPVPPATTPPQTPPVTPPAQSPGSPPSTDRRTECGRLYSATLNRCGLDPATALACRNAARDAFLACLRG